MVAPAARHAALEGALELQWFVVVGRAVSVGELLAQDLGEVDVAVLAGDVEHQPESAEIAVVGERLACRIVVVGPENCARESRAAIRSGADGYVPFREVARRLSLTVASVLVGQICVPRAARFAVAPPVLSHREREVLQLAAAGLTNGSIASRLYLSESTVKSHLSSGFRKLGVGSRSEAALALELSAPLEPGPRRSVADQAELLC